MGSIPAGALRDPSTGTDEVPAGDQPSPSLHVVAPAPVTTPAKPSSPYIVGKWYDWALFIGSPVWALAIGVAISHTDMADKLWWWRGQTFSYTGMFLGILIHAHLVAVVFRTHANRTVFKMFPLRFTLVPLAMFAVMQTSRWVLVSVSVLATFWDVYHSGAQTFGFARIYDKKAGNDALAGRRLDWWLNHLLYAGPILGGVVMMEHFGDFHEYKERGLVSALFESVPPFMDRNHAYFTMLVIAGGTAFIVYYLYAYFRLMEAGHRVSKQKVWILALTGLVSIYTWGFNSWGQAFFIMNVFHAVQYFGIVWANEKKTILRTFRVETIPAGKWIGLTLFLASTAGYGVWVAATKSSHETLWSIMLVVSIMHFWYDSFVWSVRKAQV
ncbi:MAG: hypothetical protein R3A78_14100 [Polyangiales bacterium]